MKAKFKPGDRVVILDGNKIPNYTYGWTEPMDNYIDEIHEIESSVLYRGAHVYRLKGISYGWDERGLKLAKPETIVIYRDGQKVTALDKVSGQKAVARCNSADKFDFHTGARLAFDRLIGPEKEAEKEDDDVIRVGDIVRVVNTGAMFRKYLDWVVEHIHDIELVARYAYGKSHYGEGKRELDDNFKVIVIAEDNAYIQNVSGFEECYLIRLDGLKKVKG